MWLSISLAFALWIFPETYAIKECPIDYHCNDTFIGEDNKVTAYCKSDKERSMIGRCCNLNDTILGLDLRYCDVKVMKISHTAFSKLEILDVRHNDYNKFTAEELVGLLNLNFLYLPQNIPCPGGSAAWGDTSVENTTTVCSHQLDYCKSLLDMNITCGADDRANCVRLGPGTAKCGCQGEYFGYKCLQKGSFPTTLFISTVTIPAVALSVILWFVQGRDPYKKLSVIAD